jgi:Fe-S cluster assembly iron-binding protein IscA
MDFGDDSGQQGRDRSRRDGCAGKFVTEAFDYARRTVNSKTENTHKLRIGVKRGKDHHREGKRKKGTHDLTLIKQKTEQGIWLPLKVEDDDRDYVYDGVTIQFDSKARSRVCDNTAWTAKCPVSGMFEVYDDCHFLHAVAYSVSCACSTFPC